MNKGKWFINKSEEIISPEDFYLRMIYKNVKNEYIEFKLSDIVELTLENGEKYIGKLIVIKHDKIKIDYSERFDCRIRTIYFKKITNIIKI